MGDELNFYYKGDEYWISHNPMQGRSAFDSMVCRLIPCSESNFLFNNRARLRNKQGITLLQLKVD